MGLNKFFNDKPGAIQYIMITKPCNITEAERVFQYLWNHNYAVESQFGNKIRIDFPKDWISF